MIFKFLYKILPYILILVIIPRTSSEDSEIEFLYRAPTQIELNDLRIKIETCIKCAAEATSCSYSLKSEDSLSSAYRGLLYNKTMTELFGKHAKALGLCNFTVLYINT